MSFKPSFEWIQPVEITDRATFIRRAYLHLAGAVVGFIFLSALFLFSGISKMLLRILMNGGQFGWLVVLGAFIVVSMLATRLADNVESNRTQLLGLGIYVLAEALIFAPLLRLAVYIDPAIIGAASITTGLLVGG
ncbi:permease, partial [Escherichia albertii]|nr:permease [Escherichia albertii]